MADIFTDCVGSDRGELCTESLFVRKVYEVRKKPLFSADEYKISWKTLRPPSSYGIGHNNNVLY